MTTADETFSKTPYVQIAEIKNIQRLLAEELPDNPVVLDSQVRLIESKYAWLTTIVAFYDYELLKAQGDLLGKITDGTAYAREARIKCDTAPERRARDVVEGLIKAVEQRISLVQSLMRKQNQEAARHET